MSHPLVSVIMPVHNGERYLSEAIDSILTQTYKNIEFIILDDGSTDATPDILSHFEQKDRRIKISDSPKNLGIATTLNRGISLSKGKYIARMDADDIAFPKRLEKQVAFLEAQPDCALVGCQVELMFGDKKPSGIFFNFYTEYQELKISSLFYCPFSHPAAVIRKDILLQFYYSEAYSKMLEDYHLWICLLEKNIGTNLNEALLYYRIHPSQENQIKKNVQILHLEKLYKEQFEMYNIPYTESDIETHLLIPESNNIPLTLYDLNRINIWLQKLHQNLSYISRFDNEYLDDIFRDVWTSVCWKAKHHGWSAYSFFKKGYFYKKKKKHLFFFYFFSHSFFTPLHRIYLKRKRG